PGCSQSGAAASRLPTETQGAGTTMRSETGIAAARPTGSNRRAASGTRQRCSKNLGSAGTYLWTGRTRLLREHHMPEVPPEPHEEHIDARSVRALLRD